MSGIAPLIFVIGAGPAGLMAAERAARRGARVTVVEKMPSPARKFLMAGRGGLNLTHSEPFDAFLTRYGMAAADIEPHLRNLSPSALRDWADRYGAQTFVGTSGRVFPSALKASPLLRAWLAELDGLGVQFLLRTRFDGFDEGGGVHLADVNGDKRRKRCDALILALGGASWPRLGSDGAWSNMLAGHGIAVSPFEPANAGVMVAWTPTFAVRFAGAPLKRIALRIGERLVRGEAVITAQGLEGGAVYALGETIRPLLRQGPVAVSIDLRPDITESALAARIASARKGDSLANILRKSAGLSVQAAAFLRETGHLPREATALAQHIKSATVTLAGTCGLERAISTAGGVAFKEVDERLMLKKRPGVFIAGEMLDWSAPTGGYLLQASFATGRTAGEGAMAWLAQRAHAGVSA